MYFWFSPYPTTVSPSGSIVPFSPFTFEVSLNCCLKYTFNTESPVPAIIVVNTLSASSSKIYPSIVGTLSSSLTETSVSVVPVLVSSLLVGSFEYEPSDS